MPRLSPAVHRTGKAGAANVAPGQAALTRGGSASAPHSPRVAAPSSANVRAMVWLSISVSSCPRDVLVLGSAASVAHRDGELDLHCTASWEGGDPDGRTGVAPGLPEDVEEHPARA